MFWRGRAIGELDDEAFNRNLASVTHARLRAAQGDTTGARAVLRSVLKGNPADAAAAQMLAAIKGRQDSRHREPADPRLRPVQPAHAPELAGRFRAAIAATSNAVVVARLRRLIRAIERNRGARRHAR